MAEEQKEAKPKKRMTATQAAASIGPMVKEFITGTIRARAEGKQKIAYTFIVCHHEEILRAMDVLPLWTENFAGICGAKRDSERFLQRAESLGLSRSLCTYALCGIGFDQWREELGQMPPDAPWGGQARPDFMISSGQILCDPRSKWYQASQQFMPDVPIYNIDLPYPMFQTGPGSPRCLGLLPQIYCQTTARTGDLRRRADRKEDGLGSPERIG